MYLSPELIQSPKSFYKRVHDELEVKTARIPVITPAVPDFTKRTHEYKAKSIYLQKNIGAMAKLYPQKLIGRSQRKILKKTLEQQQTLSKALNLISSAIRERLKTKFGFDDHYPDIRIYDARDNFASINFRGALENAIGTSLSLVRIGINKLLESYDGHVTNWDEFIERLKPLVKNNLETLYGFSQLHMNLARKLFNILGDYNGAAPPLRKFSDRFFGLSSNEDGSLILTPTKALQDTLITTAKRKPYFKERWPLIDRLEEIITGNSKISSLLKALNFFTLKRIPLNLKQSPAIGCPAMFITTEVTDPKTGEKKKINFIELLHHLICDLLEKVLYPQLPRLLTR